MKLWALVRTLLSGLLHTTAGLKVNGAPEILGSEGLLASPLRLSMAVGAEFCLAFLIILAPPSLARRIALVAFSVLSGIAAWAWWGQVDCGCFGYQTPKAFPFLVDIIAIIILLLCGRRSKSEDGTRLIADRRLMMTATVSASILGLLAMGGTRWWIHRSETNDQIPEWFGENLVGRKFNFLRNQKFEDLISTNSDLLLVLLRPGCDHCEQLAQTWAASPVLPDGRMDIVGISVDLNQWVVMPGVVSAQPQRSEQAIIIDWIDRREPFVAAPTFIALQNQTVIRVVSGTDAISVGNPNQWAGYFFGSAEP